MKKSKGGPGPRRRADRAAKRKAALASRNEPGSGQPSLHGRMRAAAEAFDVSHCLITDGIFDIGIGHLALARAKSPTLLTTAFFLVDVYCLGVKNAFCREFDEEDFTDTIESISGMGDPFVDIEPECARKLLHGAVDYARELGLAPHDGYRPAEALFGDIDAASCATEYRFGKDGMPLFLAGPSDSPTRIRKVMNILTKKLGSGNFHYILPAEDL